MADIRAGSRVSLDTNSGSNGVLVDHYFHRVGIVDTSEYHSPCHDVCGRPVSIQRDLSDSGNVQSLWWIDSSLERPIASSSRPT